MANLKQKNPNDTANVQTDYSKVVGKKRPFATAEAHKRLRANVMFSFAEESNCRVIGVSSAMAHEGKTTTSINLAYDMMQAGKRVLLIDADMRMSNIVKILNIRKVPGLSNLLVGAKEGTRYVQTSDMLDNLPIISCGSIPPNPSELLSSKRMSVLLDTLKEKYDYIILDLPPIAAVSDALIVSKLTDGIIQKKEVREIEKPTLTPDEQFEAVKKLKELLDGEMITREEFEKKKKEIMGL